jgi:signal transduction histidine kinase
MHRSKSVCQYTIVNDGFFEINDLAEDRRFKDMPYVKGEPFFRYYAGMPLITDEQYAIGALCVLDYKPNHLSSRQRKDLKIVAEEVMARLYLRKREKSLQNLNRFKDRLMKVVSHDLRSPLTGILGVSEFLKESDLSEKDLNDLSNIIMGCTSQMQNIIDELLDAELVQFGNVNCNPSQQNVSDLLWSVINQFKFKAENKNIEVNYTLDGDIPTIAIDEHVYKRIVSNLLSNALKFTHRRGKIQIGCQYERNSSRPNKLITTVKDNGIGMNEEQIDQLFEEKQGCGRSGTENEKSYGLGLQIVKSLCDACQGTIDVESEVGRGTSFRIEIDAPTAD